MKLLALNVSGPKSDLKYGSYLFPPNSSNLSSSEQMKSASGWLFIAFTTSYKENTGKMSS